MIALDTNVLARYILQDDPLQSRKAEHVIERLNTENRGFIPTVVLCELVWVFQSTYKRPRAACAEALDYILTTSVFEIERRALCQKALRSYPRARRTLQIISSVKQPSRRDARLFSPSTKPP